MKNSEESGYSLNVKKTTAVVDATFAVAKRVLT